MAMSSIVCKLEQTKILVFAVTREINNSIETFLSVFIMFCHIDFLVHSSVHCYVICLNSSVHAKTREHGKAVEAP